MPFLSVYCFFFNDTATNEIYTHGHTLSLHDALPIFTAWRAPYSANREARCFWFAWASFCVGIAAMESSSIFMSPFAGTPVGSGSRSEEHTSELQSLMRISYAVFCLKKKIQHISNITHNLISHKLTPTL